MELLYQNFVEETLTDEGYLKDIRFKVPENFNFGFDVVDTLAARSPEKRAMVWLSGDQREERTFTFGDMSRYSNKTANYFKTLGIRKGDRVMLVLKRHYQFWFAIVALHKLGAVAIPATNQLLTKDFVYRFDAAGIKAVVATSDGDVTKNVDEALRKSSTHTVEVLSVVGGQREGWDCFDAGVEAASEDFPRPAGEEATKNEDLMLMYFTSGTSGYPKIAAHNFTYPLGHIVTARWWHNVNPQGIHFTISDTGWGKAVWGKMCIRDRPPPGPKAAGPPAPRNRAAGGQSPGPPTGSAAHWGRSSRGYFSPRLGKRRGPPPPGSSRRARG